MPPLAQLDSAGLAEALFNESADALFLVDPQTDQLLDVNPVAVRLTGFRREELLCLKAAALFRSEPDDRRECPRQTASWLRTSQEGIWAPVTLRISRLPLRPRAVVLITARDVTEWKGAERKLQEQRAFLEQLIAHIPCAVFWKDHRSVFLGCNEQCAHDLGLSSPADVVGRTDHDLPTEQHAADFYVRCDREVMESGQAIKNIEATQHRRDGTKAVLLSSKAPLRGEDGQVVGVLGAYSDITERKAAEELVRNRERLFRAVIEAAGAVPYTRDYSNDRFEYVGPGIEALLGYPAEVFTLTLWRSLVREIVPFGTQHGLPLDEARRLFQEDPSPGWCGDFRVVNARGEERWLFNACVKMFGPRGEVVGTWGLLQDITQRKQAEERLNQAQKMEAVGRLAGGIAHDFNNLLTGILGNLALVRGKVPAGDEAVEQLGAAEQAAWMAAGLTRQLLAFSRRALSRPCALDLGAHVKENVTLLSRVLGKEFEVEVRVATGLWPVHADPTQVAQVLMNLLLNARDAMPHGGCILVEADNVTLDEDEARSQAAEVVAGPGGAAPQEFVRLRVRDTGTGMTAEVKARIFEPFFTTKEPGRGTGLGLAVVHGIITQHGGWVQCDSRPGEGSCFEVFLPRHVDAEGEE
jgi:PAS domain S-box-containing protein